MKAFISYSHADEEHMRHLKSHLAGLQRLGIITSWYDRKIVPGEGFDERILEELAAAQLVLMLISSDFVASDYCMNVEVEQALEQNRVGRSRVIPIVVRPEASWKDFPFGKLLALPTDGKPITSWANRDEAWECVAKGIRLAVDSLRAASAQSGAPAVPHLAYVDELDSVDGPLVHPRARKVSLRDIFVYPDLELIDGSATGKLVRSADKLLGGGLTIIVGDRQSGKTALLRRVVIDRLREDERALYVDLRGQNLDNLHEIVRRTAATKFALPALAPQSSTSEALQVIALDNLDLARNTDSAFDRVTELMAKCKRVIVTVSSESSFSRDFRAHNLLDATSYFLNRFSVNKRRDLIEKWVGLGSTASSDDQDAEVERREEEMNLILRRNVVPSLPAHVLLVLQGLESGQIGKSELTSYGHCYNLMIVSALANAGVKPSEIDSYVNVLTELSYAMHVLGVRSLPEREVTALLEEYKENYIAPPTNVLIATLVDSCLLQRSNGDLLIFRYVSGYFAGKHIADNLGSNDTIRARLNFLADNAHNDDCALVLLFVCHHTKNPAVLDTILLNLMVSLDTHRASDLAPSDFADLARALSDLPNAVVRSEATKLSRVNAGNAQQTASLAAEEIDNMSRDLDAADDVARLLRAVKALEITGQLVRNRFGSLPVARLSELIREAINCAQRIAGFIIEYSKILANAVPELLVDIRADNVGVSTEQVERDLRAFLIFNSHFALHGLLRLLSQQLANDALRPLVLKEIGERNDAFAILLRAHVALKAIDPAVIAELKNLLPRLEKNPFATGLLRRAVADRLQLFNIAIEDKQRIAEMFDIPVNVQVVRNRYVVVPKPR